MNHPPKILYILVGPTASGKTAWSLRWAKGWNTDIVSADSRQCFRELNIGVAKPSTRDLKEVKHYFINSHSILDEVNASRFASLARTWVGDILQKNDRAVMVGGTGMYVHAFLYGLDDIPPIDPEIRNGVRVSYKEEGIAWLQERLCELDPAFVQKGEMQNPQRMMRALEVRLSTGKSILDYRKGGRRPLPFQTRIYGLELPMEELKIRIDRRVDEMMEAGLLQEVESLRAYQDLNALQTVGYRELFQYLNGELRLDEAVTRIKQHTRQYAKRQMTFFRKNPDIRWISPGQCEKIMES